MPSGNGTYPSGVTYGQVRYLEYLMMVRPDTSAKVLAGREITELTKAEASKVCDEIKGL